MGLLDSLPAGLLDIIRNSAQNQNTNIGIGPMDAGYQPFPMVPQQPPAIIQAPPDQSPQPDQSSPLDTAKWPYGPVGAPPNANASAPRPAMAAPQQTAPMALAPPPAAPAQPSGPGLGDRLAAGLKGFAGGARTGLMSAISGGVEGASTGQTPDFTSPTEKALLAKGIDPVTVKAAIANPELMKTLITQNYGPQTMTSIGEGYVADQSGKISRAYVPEKAPTTLGNGYIYDPVAHKVVQAYEPEDKIPAGFAKGDDGQMHYIPGGPADPVYLRLAEAQKKDPNANIVLGRGGEIVKNNPDGTVTVMHKNEAEAPVPMDPNALEILARREIGGDFSGRKNLGRGAQGAADLKAITNKSSEILTNEMGMSPTDAAAHLLRKQQEFAAQGQGLNSEARTTGVREANLNLILKAADAAIPAALDASDKVARTGWVPINKIIQGGEVMTSDPDLKKFGMANLQLAEHWARAMNPTGVMRESDRDKALTFLSTADSKDTYKAAVGQLRTQIERERDAVHATRGMTDLPGSTAPSTPATNGINKTSTGVQWTVGK